MEALTEHSLVTEVATGTFCFKNKISASSVATLWEKISRFVADALKQQKGVLVPNLGTFTVGPVVGETRKKVRPSFTLLETRYAGVSQERPKYAIGGRCPVVQPGYGLLATAAAVHRGACQRLILELMQRLAVHILSGRAIQVSFPGVGRLFTNKAGRIQFEFDSLLREYFELERERVIPEMDPASSGTWQGPPEGSSGQGVAHLVKGLQQVHLHDPPAIKSRPTSGTAAGSGTRSLSPSARVKRHAHAPYKGELLDLFRLCSTNDRIRSGCVLRLQLEQWLHRECPQLLSHVAAGTVLELLSTNTYGKTGKHILYKPFLDRLEAAVTKQLNSPPRLPSPTRVVEVRIDSPSVVQRHQLDQQRQQLDVGVDDQAAEVTLAPGGRTGQDAQQQQQSLSYLPYPADGQYQPAQPSSYPMHGQQLYSPQGYSSPYPYQQHPSPQPYPPQAQHQTSQQYLRQQPQQPPQHPTQEHVLHPPPGHGQWLPHAQPQPGHQYQQRPLPTQPQPQPDQQQQSSRLQSGLRPQALPQSASQKQSVAVQRTPSTAARATPPAWQEPPVTHQLGSSSDSTPYHYFQNQLSPRSRRDFDNFNRLHFQQLKQARGSDYKHRAVTPKVGEDQLNLQEYRAMQLSDVRGCSTPAQVFSLPDDPPYSRDVQHRRRGSVGPQPQILTLAHDSPRYSYVPGLPSHPYQQQHQPQATTSQQPYVVQQPGPIQESSSGRQPVSPVDEEPPISQYDIINEADPIRRQKKRSELAHALNRDWSEQIREKEALLENLAGAEAQWPYMPTRQPNDKRPLDAVSRPATAWGP